MPADPPRRRLNPRVAIAVALAAVAIAAITVAIALQGPDVTILGEVTVVEGHRLCVTDATGEQCAHVDEPGHVRDVRVGDCVRARRSGSGVLESVEAAAGCRWP